MEGGEVRRAAAWPFVRAIVRSQAHGVTGAVISGLLWQTGAVGAPLVVKYAIDHGIVTRDHHTLLIWLLVLLGVGLLEVCAGAFRHLYAIRNRSHSDARVRDALFAHALRLDAAYHDRVGPGELLSRASSDSQHIARMMDAIGHTIGYALTVVAVAVVMLTLDAELALVVLIPVPQPGGHGPRAPPGPPRRGLHPRARDAPAARDRDGALARRPASRTRPD